MTFLTSLRRLLGGSPTTGAAADAIARTDQESSDRRAEEVRPAGLTEAPGSPPGDDTDRRFWARLLGLQQLRPARIEAAEQRVIDQLDQLADSRGDPNLVPRLPVILPRLIGLVRRDDVSSRELTENLLRDPTLVGEVVRIANSPRYRTAREIASVQDAVTMLGQRGLVQLVIQAAMRPIFDHRLGRFSRNAGTLPWDLTERCSHACVRLGGGDPFQAYLAGMVVNMGLICALRALDLSYQEPQAPDTEGFHDALTATAARLSAQIAHQWEFPTDICQAVRRSGARTSSATQDALTRCLRSAVRTAKWQLMQPGLAGDALADLNDEERACYADLEKAFGHG